MSDEGIPDFVKAAIVGWLFINLGVALTLGLGPTAIFTGITFFVFSFLLFDPEEYEEGGENDG